MANNDKCLVIAPLQGRRIDLGDFEMLVKADAATTGGVVSVLEATEPAGFGPPTHIHEDAAEAFYVLDGEYVMTLDGEEHRCPAGTFIFIPAGVPHGFRVAHAPSRKLNFYFPAAMTGYFDDLAAALGRSDVTDTDLAEIAKAHHMHIVGPPSERYV
jgi:mannose-6-phosphate isomerase-like protein (cupin superfamily)